jgi:hypothetical protein
LSRFHVSIVLRLQRSLYGGEEVPEVNLKTKMKALDDAGGIQIGTVLL